MPITKISVQFFLARPVSELTASIWVSDRNCWLFARRISISVNILDHLFLLGSDTILWVTLHRACSINLINFLVLILLRVFTSLTLIKFQINVMKLAYTFKNTNLVTNFLVKWYEPDFMLNTVFTLMKQFLYWSIKKHLFWKENNIRRLRHISDIASDFRIRNPNNLETR